MAARSVDPIASFQHIVDNVPTWRVRIADLTTFATKRYEEYAVEYQRMMAHVRVKKQKTASISSLHGSEDFALETAANSKIPEPTNSSQPDYLEAGNRFIVTQAHRRRRPGTSAKSAASGSKVQRNKKLVVIYYDSHIQEELDKLVKALGAARNTLRKGKLSYTAAKGFALPNLSRRDNLVPNPMSRLAPTLSKTSSEPLLTIIPNDIQGAFLQIDKETERIQNWCESAAHQAIRTGDIISELENSASKLDTILTMANSAIETLQAEQATTAEANDEEIASSNESLLSSQATLREIPSFDLVPAKSLSPLFEKHELHRPILTTAQSEPNGILLTGAIEVDDDDDEEDSDIDITIDMSNFRATARMVS